MATNVAFQSAEGAIYRSFTAWVDGNDVAHPPAQLEIYSGFSGFDELETVSTMLNNGNHAVISNVGVGAFSSDSLLMGTAALDLPLTGGPATVSGTSGGGFNGKYDQAAIETLVNGNYVVAFRAVESHSNTVQYAHLRRRRHAGPSSNQSAQCREPPRSGDAVDCSHLVRWLRDRLDRK